jgi:hypothetical protein
MVGERCRRRGASLVSLLRATASVLVLLCACDDEGPSSCGPEGCSSECRALTGETCDLLEADCRQRILDAVICVRGTPGTMPEVRTITEEEYWAELTPEPSDMDAGVDDSVPNPFVRALRLLRMWPLEQAPAETVAEVTLTNTAAYYESWLQRITLVDRGTAEYGKFAYTRLAHELVHALQDQTFGLEVLGDRLSGSADAYAAERCLTEGEASLYSELAFELLSGLALRPEDFDFEGHLKYTRSRILESEASYLLADDLAYPVGTRYLFDAWTDGGPSAVTDLYWAPPPSAIHWMHGYAAGNDRGEPLLLSLACANAAAPEGYEYYYGDSLGPFYLFAFLGHNLREDGVYETARFWQESMGWRQDELTVFDAEPARTALSWRVRFDSAERAKALARELEALVEPDLVVHVRGSEIEILASDDPATLEGWSGTDSTACPRPE